MSRQNRSHSAGPDPRRYAVAAPALHLDDPQGAHR
jgi:hypothetical protein